MTYQRPAIARMAGYTWGEQPQDRSVVKLNTNENPYPPSPAVGQALKSISVAALRTYPPPTADPLRDRLAELHGLARNNIIVTNGGDEALRLAFTTFVEPGANFGMAEPSYSLYPVLAAVQGATVTSVAMDENWDLPRDFARQLNDAGTNLTCLVNPHAPSGALLDADRVGQLANDLNGVLLIDEAYVDFVEPSLRYDVFRLIDAFDNLLVLRTFSKGYSLAGLRLGYLVGCEKLIEPILTKTRDSYNVDYVSQVLGTAALADRAYAEKTWAQVRADRRALRDGLLQHGFRVNPSHANFLLAEVPISSPRSAAELYRELKDRGILVRHFDTPLMADKLRITVGTPEQNQLLLQQLGEILNSAAPSQGNRS